VPFDGTGMRSPVHVAPVAEPPQSLAVVSGRVRRILGANAEFRALPAERQRVLAQDMVRAGAAAARALAVRQSGDRAVIDEPAGAGERSPSQLVESVDFPSFVAALIEGTFEAIVDASIRQMEAYTELLRSVAKSVDEFMRDYVIEARSCHEHVAESRKGDSARRRLAATRQQLLATMVLMGINRIVVTDGKISAGVIYELEVR
jgi:hypothetical protein